MVRRWYEIENLKSYTAFALRIPEYVGKPLKVHYVNNFPKVERWIETLLSKVKTYDQICYIVRETIRPDKLDKYNGAYCLKNNPFFELCRQRELALL